MSQRGFTLVEVLVAMVVLAMGLGAISVTMASYTRNGSLLRDRALGLFVAHNRLTEIELLPVWPPIGESDGDLEFAGRKWRWEATVSKTDDDELRRVDLRVRAEDDDGGLGEDSREVASLSGFIGSSGRKGE